MAKKNKGKQAKAAMNVGGDDADVLKDAYQESLKKRLDIFFDAFISDPAAAEARLRDGISELRAARDKATEIL